MIVKVLGLAVSGVAATTVRLAGITTGLLEAEEVMVTEPLYDPALRLPKFATPTVKLPGVLPLVALLAMSQLPPVVAATAAL